MAGMKPYSLHVYESSLDRAGLAIAGGGALTGLAVVGLVVLGGRHAPAALALAWLLGSLAAMLGLTALAGPVWLAFHLAGWRRPCHAAFVGAGLAMLVFVAVQTGGFGLVDAPPSDTRTLAYRWISAVATSAVLAVIAAGIALAMWRVAYRRTP